MVRARTKSSTAPDDTQLGPRASTSGTASNIILSEREALIQEKQSDLGRIFTRHDSLIREQFMLENYGLMLFYDPDVAKQDQTNEFLQFKNKHDLMRFMPNAGPSRATRRAQTDRISAMSHGPEHTVIAPVPAKAPLTANKPSAAAAKHSTSTKGKQKESARSANGVHISAKARGKRKAVDESLDARSVSDGDHAMESVSSRRIVSMIRERLKGTSDFKRSSSRTSRSQSVLTDDTSSTRPAPSVSERSTRKSLRDAKATSSLDVQPMKRRRLSDEATGGQRHLRITLPFSPLKTTSPPAEIRPTTSGKSLPGKTLPTNAAPRPVIRRIKLIVRPPARTYSSPRQRPSPALFGYSLPALLASYVDIDGKTYKPAELESAARHDASIFKRLEGLEKKGRYYPGQNLLDDDISPKYTHRDAWSNVMSEAISARNAISRHRFGHGGALAAVIQSKLHVHWDLVKKDMEREQVLEERRLRVLAKSILKLVLAEWKKAVFHVREQARLAFEAEEARRGRQHLDAILDQSGQILEKQQLELVRSESSSMDSDEEEDGEETDADASADEDEEAVSEVATEVDEDEEGAPPDQKAERHVDFEVPLNDVDVDGDDISPRPDTRQSSAVISETGDNFEDKDSKSSHDLDEPETPAKSGDAREELHAGREVSLDMDQDDDEHPSFEANVSSPKTSLESTSFMEDIRINGDELLHPDLALESDPIGIPPLGLSNGLEHESIIVHEPVIEQLPDPASLPSKQPSRISTCIEFSKIAPHVTGPLAVSTDTTDELKLPNGHLGPIDHANVDSENNALPPPAEDVSSLKAEALPFLQVNSDAEPGITPRNVSPAAAPESGAKVALPEHASESEAETKESGNEEDIFVSEAESEWEAPPELQAYAVTHVKWEPGSKVLPPLLLRGTLRPYQQSGLEWLASLHNNETNGILADEMGLGKTIQTIALLAHLACDRGIWGPHLIIVPTSVLLNWEMEFKKFLPGFNILSYHGTTKRRKELRRGWNDKYAFNVCVTSYTLASRDQHIFKRKAWYYMVLDEAHMIKNFKSQRWNILLMFRSHRRLLLTGTPLQNNLTELWALLRFLMSGTNFANQKEFSEWFGIPLEKAIELGNLQDQEVQLQVTKLHEMLRPFLLRRMKKDVEKELPKKYDHLVLCRLSKRQRFLYDEFMSRRQTREDLQSGVYQKIANILMQLRKVCNHPDLFEVRPIVTSFAMEKSAIADFEIKELLIRRRFLEDEDRSLHVSLDVVGLQFTHLCNMSRLAAQSTSSLEEILAAELIASSPGEPPPKDLCTIEGFRRYNAYQRRLEKYLRFQHMVYLNRLRCNRHVLFGLEAINAVRRLYNPLTTTCEAEFLSECRPANHLIKSYLQRAEEMSDLLEKFAFATPTAVARDIPEIALREVPAEVVESLPQDFDSVLHKSAVKLQIAFPDVSLLQYDCGKLQELDRLLRERHSGGHRVLIFTQMTRILDILEVFLNFHGYLYLRLDGATKIEDRQYITERFNADPRIFAFIASSRSGGVGINLTGADTVIFYDSDFNPQMDKQCEDRAHRIGQIRDVHIYRFISQYTVEEAMLRKANQKRSLDDIVIQQGDFDWKNFFRSDSDGDENGDADGPSSKATALQKALVEFEDFEDVEAARVAAREEAALQGEDRAEFGDGDAGAPETPTVSFAGGEAATPVDEDAEMEGEGYGEGDAMQEEEEGGTTVDYMVKFVRSDFEFFREWKL